MEYCSLARDKDFLVEASLHLPAYLDFDDTYHGVALLLLRWSLSAQYLLTLGEVFYEACSGVLPDSENGTGGSEGALVPSLL